MTDLSSSRAHQYCPNSDRIFTMWCQNPYSSSTIQYCLEGESFLWNFYEMTPSIYLQLSAILSYRGGESTFYKVRFYILLQQLSILILKGLNLSYTPPAFIRLLCSTERESILGEVRLYSPLTLQNFILWSTEWCLCYCTLALLNRLFNRKDSFLRKFSPN